MERRQIEDWNDELLALGQSGAPAARDRLRELLARLPVDDGAAVELAAGLAAALEEEEPARARGEIRRLAMLLHAAIEHHLIERETD